jgi:hypothetical protein
MINLQQEDWFIPGVKQVKIEQGESAKQVAVVIDNQIAFFIGVKEEIANKLIGASSFQECDNQEGLFCVSFDFEGSTEIVLCNEMTQAGLLSFPNLVIVDKNIHTYAELAEPGWLYIEGQFIIPGVYE